MFLEEKVEVMNVEFVTVKAKQTFNRPCSSMKPIIIGTAVKTPIWTKNWAFNAASRAVFPEILAWREIAESSPDSACIFWINRS